MHRLTVFLLVFFICFLFNSPSIRGEECVSIFLSYKLRPYQDVVKGIKNKFHAVNVFSVEEVKEDNPYALDSCIYKVAVGLKAVRYLSSYKHPEDIYDFFVLVLYPWLFEGELSSFYCGIYLEFDPRECIEAIISHARWVKSVAVVYSDERLIPYIESIKEEASKRGFNPKLVRISTGRDFRLLLKHLKGVDAVVFVPDPIFSTDSVIRAAVTTLVSNGKLVIGYNRYFLEVGAGIAIVTDYTLTGEKLYDLVTSARKGQCHSFAAVHKVLVNENVLKKLKKWHEKDEYK